MPRFPKSSATAGSLSDGVFGQLSPSDPSRPVTPLHVGDTYLEPIACARAEAQKTDDHPRLHNYAPVQGEPALLDAILEKVQRRSGVSLARDNVQVMAGATCGLGVVCAALLEPGDEVILPSPYWPLIRGILRSHGAVPVEVPLFTRLDEPDFDPIAAIGAAIGPRTVAIYLNIPNNPTGAVLTDDAVDRLGTLAAENDLWIFSDEVYEDTWFGDAPPRSCFASETMAPRTLATHSLSKSYGLAGSRVGYTHGPASIMEVIRNVQTFATYCAPRPMQLGAARALAQGDGWLADARKRYGDAGREAAHSLGLPMPPAGTFLFFDTSKMSSKPRPLQTVLQNALDAGVMLTPGTACGTDFGSWARLCFTSVAPAELSDALRRLLPTLCE